MQWIVEGCAAGKAEEVFSERRSRSGGVHLPVRQQHNGQSVRPSSKKYLSSDGEEDDIDENACHDSAVPVVRRASSLTSLVSDEEEEKQMFRCPFKQEETAKGCNKKDENLTKRTKITTKMKKLN